MGYLLLVSHVSFSHAAALAGQFLYLVVESLVGGIEQANLAQQFQLSVHIVTHILVEELEVVQYLLSGVYLRILS